MALSQGVRFELSTFGFFWQKTAKFNSLFFGMSFIYPERITYISPGLVPLLAGPTLGFGEIGFEVGIYFFDRNGPRVAIPLRRKGNPGLLY